MPELVYSACELDVCKRKVLLAQTLQPEIAHLYGDIASLEADRAFCFKTQRYEAVVPPDIVICGFPCQDLSCLRHKAPAFERGAGSRSGDVFFTLADLVGKWQPLLILLENVEAVLHRRAVDAGQRPWDVMLLGFLG